MSTIKITVTRYNPETSSERFTQSYTIPYKEDMVVLDALNYIKNHVDGNAHPPLVPVGWGFAVAAA